MIQTHVFRDGIERPAHQHSNGGGWVADTATASSEAYIGPRAEVIGGTIWGGTIWGGTIEGGTIWGGTIEGGTIWGGTIWGGTIEGGTIRGGTIEGGTIRGGTIRGGAIRGGAIRGGTIYGGTIDGGTIRGGTIRGGAIRGGAIYGGAIYGGTIRGGTIRGGNVTRDVTFVCGAIPYQVTITDDFVGVGCQWHSPEHWLKLGAEIMTEDGQTPERAAFFMGLLITFIDLHGCKTTVSANA